MQTEIAFHTQAPPYGPTLPDPENVVIAFERRRFVWHATHTDHDGNECWPTVTTVVDDGDAYEEERQATERFLSTLSYHFDQPIEVVGGRTVQPMQEMDRPMVIAMRSEPANAVQKAPFELIATDDARLWIVMGYYRDGLSTGSPFFRFLAFFNALEVACENRAEMDAWLRAEPRRVYHWQGEGREAPTDLARHFREERRHAVAHAVRDRNVADLDPNDPDLRARFGSDSRLLKELVQDRVRERWGPHAVWTRSA